MSGKGQIAFVRRLAADEDAPRVARDLADEALAELGRGDERSDDLALVVSELVTNAVVHGRGPDIEIRIEATRRTVRVEVTDRGTGSLEWPADTEDGLWGLGLVSTFADRVGIIRRPSTRVWCELDIAQSPSG